MSKDGDGYPLVDLFAGSGGFSEGFAELKGDDDSPAFQPVACIERDVYAYQTLLLRHFFRLFRLEDVPESYYDYLARGISKEELVGKNKPHWELAQASALHISLEKENHNRVKTLLSRRLRGKKKWALIGGPPCQVHSNRGAFQDEG